MSLTSYRAAPPRGGRFRGCERRSAAVRAGARKRVVGGGRGPLGAAGCGAAAAARAPVQAWRRPALPPLGGQYPGRGAVSRPSSEWGRVGPARCDHQVGRGVQRSEIRGQRSDDAGGDPGAARPGLIPESVKLMGMGFRVSEIRDQRSEGAGAPGWAPPSSDL